MKDDLRSAVKELIERESEIRVDDASDVLTKPIVPIAKGQTRKRGDLDQG